MGSTLKNSWKWIFWTIYFIVLYSLYVEFAGVPIEDVYKFSEIRERNYFIIGLLLIIPAFYLTIKKNWYVQAGVLVGLNYQINNNLKISIEEREIRYNRLEMQFKRDFWRLNVIPWVVVLIAILLLIKSNIVMSILVIFVTSISLVYISKNDIFRIFRPEKSFRSPDSIKINFFHSVDQQMSEKDRMSGP